MPDLSKQYEIKLEKLIRAYSKRIQDIYHQSINEISLYSALSSTGINGLAPQAKIDFLSKTLFDAFPAIRAKLDEIMNTMHDGIYSTVSKAITDGWQLSNHKNDKISDQITKGTALSTKATDLIYNPNQDALDAFIKRKTQGLNLSDRVWNLVEPYKFELEAGLADGIGKGKSAASMATDLKKYLNEPDKLFRRVRDEEGSLKLSKAAKNYKPGQGTYRSSYQNALRLTGTETNISYRSSDHERWKSQPFTKGIEIRLSNNHPEFDICDALCGLYPVGYKHVGFHPRCRCYSVPILVSDDEYDKQENFLLGLTDKQPEIDRVEEIPDKAKNWIKDNAKRINSWSSKPYWAKDNPKYINPLLKKKK